MQGGAGHTRHVRQFDDLERLGRVMLQPLPAAAANGVAVMTNMPFEKARLFRLVEGQEVPDFAKEAGIRSWSHFFLKWIMKSQMAVTQGVETKTVNIHDAKTGALG